MCQSIMNAPSTWNLSDKITQATEMNGGKPDHWSVLSAAKDPYRLDTPANHRDGAWFAAQLHTQELEQDPPELEPMFSTDDDWATATKKLKDVKNYVD